MLTHVLVPIDGSELAERALEYARQIVDAENGKITLLTAIDVPEYSVVPFYPMPGTYNLLDMLDQDIVPKTKDYLSKIAETLQKEGYTVNVEAVIGDAADVIVERAKDLNTQAIVMSTHGRSGISRWLLGSVANKVLGSAPCPVFIIPMRSS